MFRCKNGVTLMTVAVTVLIMVIIAAVTISAGGTLLKNTEKGKIQTFLYVVKAKAGILLEDYMFDGTDNLGGTVSSEYISEVGWSENSSYIYRVWNASKYREQEIDTTNLSSVENCIIQYDIVNGSVDVAYTKGFKDENGNLLYKLSDIDK